MPADHVAASVVGRHAEPIAVGPCQRVIIGGIVHIAGGAIGYSTPPIPQPMQRSCAVVGAAAVAKAAAAMRAGRVFVIGVSLSAGPPAQAQGARTTAFRPAEPIAQGIVLSDFAPPHAFDAVVRGAIDSMPGVFGTRLRTDGVLAISCLCAGNPASPQSVPASVLLNFFMPAPDSRWRSHSRHGHCR